MGALGTKSLESAGLVLGCTWIVGVLIEGLEPERNWRTGMFIPRQPDVLEQSGMN